MKIKIDTKEKFRVIYVEEQYLSANLSDNLRKLLLNCLNETPPNIVLNLHSVEQISPEVAETLQDLQQQFYDKKQSFVICALQPEVEGQLDAGGTLENLNATPTESEAWDIIQMEEIERELFSDENDFE